MAGGINMASKVVQVTNIAPQATKDQMQSLFGNIGKIDEIRLYPTIRDVSCPVISRICYVKYFESSCVAVAQHLTNTVFIDRALIVCPVQSGYIPDEFRALEMTNNGSMVPGLQTPDSHLPPEVVNRIEGMHPNQIVRTADPKLTENNLPDYPALPAAYDGRRIEEIRRTIIVLDIPSDWHLDDLMDLFGQVGEVKYARFAEKNREKFAMIEFCEQKSIIEALKMQGTRFHGEYLNIYHSTSAINKPEAKSNEAAQREIEEAMSIVKEAQNMISAAIDPVIGMLSKDKSRRRTRSRSRSHRRSRSRSKRSHSRKRSRSKGRSRRTRSRSRKRSRSPSKSRSKRSKSKRSRSRSKRRSKSKSRMKRSSSRSYSRRSPSRSRSKRTRSRDRRKRSKSRRRSRTRSPVSHRRRTRSRDRKRSRSRERRRSSRKEEKRHRSRSRSRSRHRRSHSRGATRSSRAKDSSRSTKRRSRSTDSKKLKRLTDDGKKPVRRDYDAEENIGAEEPGGTTIRPPELPVAESPAAASTSSSSTAKNRSASPEKSDNMDISNSP